MPFNGRNPEPLEEIPEAPDAIGMLKTHCDGRRGMRSRHGTTILTARTSMSHWRTACRPG